MIFEVVKVKYKQFYNDMWYAKCMGFHSELTLSLRMQSNLYSLQINWAYTYMKRCILYHVGVQSSHFGT